MRIVIILIAALWGAVSIIAFVRTRDKPVDAKLTAAYILAYPVVAVGVFLNEPVPLWLAVPVVFGFLPWLMAGPHLGRILRQPAVIDPNEIIGIPRAYWVWGGLGSIALGLIFS